ncbi:hypothetical protein ACF0H5_009350 [Mactra antiquata]
MTVQSNLSFYVVPTPKPPLGGWSRDSTLHAGFVYMAAALLMFAIRYSAVFWFTNKVFSSLFATQLLFMTIDCLSAHCGFSVLYKLSTNYDIYAEHVNIILGPGTTMFLYVLSGTLLMFSTFFVYTYGANYFQKKFEIVDKRHHPEAYRKQTIIINGSCQDYRTHTAAMVSLVLLGILKGPIVYDLVSLYRVAKDNMILTCIIVDVCYLVFWVILWTVLTLKQKWQFRILDYVPLNQPVFMISNENLVKSSSYHGGSIDLSEHGKKKRPSSLPSELTASESGFGDVNSSEDERDRFELSLPPLAEERTNLASSRRKGSTHSLDRRSRHRRNGNQRVTFHETVKRSTSTDSELCARRQLSIAADVHGNGVMDRSIRPNRGDRIVSPLELDALRVQRHSNRHSTGFTPSGSKIALLNNALYKHSPSCSDVGSTSDYSSEKSKSSITPDNSLEYNDLTIKNNYAYGAKGNLKSTNMETQTNSNDTASSRNGERTNDLQKALNSRELSPKNNNSNNRDVLSEGKSENGRNRLSPRTIEFVDRKHDITLGRRDSANYSLTSSQETASNDSDQAQQTLISQV